MANLILKPPPIYDPLESWHQEQIFYMAHLHKKQYPELQHLFAVPNGGFRHKTTAEAMKRQGVKKGVPDTCLPLARGGYCGLFMELKRFRAGSLTPEQKIWLSHLAEQGYHAVMCRGWEEAWRELVWYVSLPKTEIGYNKSVPPWCS